MLFVLLWLYDGNCDILNLKYESLELCDMCTVPSVSSVLKITYLASKQLLGYMIAIYGLAVVQSMVR